jgi:multidrug efflux pump subunit AcrB
VKFGGNVPVETAQARLAGFEREVMADKRLKRMSASYGSEPGVLSLGSGQMAGEVTYNLTYQTRLEREATSWEIEADLREKLARIPGVVVAEAYDFGTTVLSTVKAPVNIRLFAEDWRQLPAAAARAERALYTVPGFTSVASGWDMLSQEAVLALDEEKARSLGLTPDLVAAQLPLKGGAVASLSRLPGVASLPVRLYFAEPYRSRLEPTVSAHPATGWQQHRLGRGGAGRAPTHCAPHHHRCPAIHPGSLRLPRHPPHQ